MSSSLPPTQATWAINESATSTISIARGLLEAATSDNIQPLALLSCESFGATLPLCPETRVKVEQLARQSHTSHVLNFIKAQVGYRKGDSVEQLARSDAGIRFLCLVAVLCTLGHHEAALILDSLLQETQRETQMRPTILQLQAVMELIGSKLALSDFAKSIAGWEIWFRSLIRQILEPGYQFSVAAVPTKPALQSLILAMSESGRLGEECSLSLKVGSQYVPWCIAFVKWCLGVPPLVRLATGKTLLDQQESPVVLHVLPCEHRLAGSERAHQGASKTRDRTFQVAILRNLNSIKEIVFEDGRDHNRVAWKGMMDIRTWINYRLNILFDKFPIIQTEKTLKEAVGQALYFIVKHVPLRMHFGLNERQTFGPYAFPNTDARIRLAEALLGDDLPLVRLDSDPNLVLRPKNLARMLGTACSSCRESSLGSSQPKGTGGGPTGSWIPCDVSEFLEEVGSIGAALLVFALFGDAHDLDGFPMIRGGPDFDEEDFDRWHHTTRRHYAERDPWLMAIVSVWQPMMHDLYHMIDCRARFVFRYAAKLLGHAVSDSTIISSGGGQVLYPAFFGSSSFIHSGYLQMSAFPGQLRWEGMCFNSMIDSWSEKVDIESLSRVALDDHEWMRLDEAVAGGQERGDNGEIRLVGNSHDGDGSDVGCSTPRLVHSSQHLADIVGCDFVPDRLQPFGDGPFQWSVSVAGSTLRGEVRLAGSNTAAAWSFIRALGYTVFTPPCAHSNGMEAGDGLHSAIASAGGPGRAFMGYSNTL
ncbi:hypothetical protein FGG08_000477 [Glutinoglossum americanum]|uniref:Uncharacterized protein n=1 Tax=Glutinoglossum americanum TaxID=1670608 RepID=A0A9P8I3V0_9PEZI|nr:hypothetical protein FGG08_000477 [Glutinoglossum americanum]